LNLEPKNSIILSICFKHQCLKALSQKKKI